MRFVAPIAALGAAFFCMAALGATAAEAEPPRSLYDAYRADVLEPVAGASPDAVQMLPQTGENRWPRALRSKLEARILAEWEPEQIYGPVHASSPIWLRYPLVTARVGGRVLVPVLGRSVLPIEGALDLPADPAPRRVVILVDASASANALTPFRTPDDGVERIPILEAERRALDHLVDMLGDEGLDFGVIAFGEGTWPIARPGGSGHDLRAGLKRFRRERPRGEGRTDAVCALWTAYEWLEDTPRGVEREIIMLTDGEMPHSGRFADCDGSYVRRSERARETCEARLNTTVCPARRRMRPVDGASDVTQLASFARRTAKKVRVTPLVFEPDRSARIYERLARRTGSRVVRVPSPQAIEVALPALVSSRVRGVFARNLTSGETTGDLLDEQNRIRGALTLQAGANDVELRVESDRGVASLFRFRVYSAEGELERYLAELRRRNERLQERSDVLADQTGEEMRRRVLLRELSIVPEQAPAAPAP